MHEIYKGPLLGFCSQVGLHVLMDTAIISIIQKGTWEYFRSICMCAILCGSMTCAQAQVCRMNDPSAHIPVAGAKAHVLLGVCISVSVNN